METLFQTGSVVQEAVNEVLKPYLDALIRQVFAKNTHEMKRLLSSQLRKQQQLMESELFDTEEGMQRYQEVEEAAKVMGNYVSTVETIVDLLTEKCAEEIYFDTYHWERYKQLQKQNQQLLEDNHFLREQVDHWTDLFEGKSSQDLRQAG
jgi:hypothetical protein